MENVQDVTRSFDVSGNVQNWIKKIRLVAKLKEVKKLAGADINIVPVTEPVPRVEARPQRERRPPERDMGTIYTMVDMC